jgi:membrane fusion protein (multidrug efflux system)
MHSPKPHKARRLVIVGLFCLLVYGGVIGVNRYFTGMALAAMASMSAPTASVSVAEVQSQSWPEQIDAVGTLEARQGAQLTAQTSGIVTQVLFESGQTAEQGQLLVQLNDNQAKAQLAKDQAALENARFQMARQKKLIASKNTSQEAEQAADAAMREAQASVQADQAQLENLQIRAPFDGHLGLRSVSPGQYVTAGTGVVDLQQWNPLRLVFDIPQRQLPRIAIGDAVSLSINGYPDKRFQGKISAIGAALDDSTRSVRVEALIDNPDDLLRPGMFGQVQVRLANTLQVLAIPRTAITYNTYGEYLYLVEKGKDGDTVQQRLVKVGMQRGDLVQVTDGVKEGEQVVTSGQVKLYPGSHVKIVADPALSANAATESE